MLAVITGLSASSVFAGQLTLDEAVKQAKLHNISIKTAEKQLEQAEQSYLKAFSGYMPQVSLNGSAGQSGSDSAFSRSFSYGASASLSLFSGFSTMSELRSADAARSIARASLDRAVSDTIYNVKKSFIDLLWAQDSVTLAEKILKRRAENHGMIQLKYESGREDKGSLLRVEADLAQARYDLAKAKRYVQTASAALAKTIGNAELSDITAEGDILCGKPDGKTYGDTEIRNTPEYRTAKYNLEKASAELSSAKSSFYPTVSASGSASKSGSEWAPDNYGWNASLGISYQLFSGGRDARNLKIAEINKSIYEGLINNKYMELNSSIISAANGFIDSYEAVNVREKYFSASELQAKINTTKYMNGLTTYQDWYTIENDYTNAEKTILSSKKEAALSEAGLKNILGE